MVYYLDSENSHARLEAAKLLGIRDSRVSKYRKLIKEKVGEIVEQMRKK